MKYTVQRPTIEWVEVEIASANSLEHALELADEVFKHGEYEYVDNTWSIDYWRFRVEDENGKVFFEEEEKTECKCKNCSHSKIEARGVCLNCYQNACDKEDGSCD